MKFSFSSRMFSLKNRRLLCLALGGFLIIGLDQILKSWALRHQEFHWYVINPWLGWEYFSNPGIAFSLAVPQLLILVLTPPVIIGLWFFLWRRKNSSYVLLSAGILITAGAVSNYIDRLFGHATVDYLRIIFSVINLADCAIVLGAFLLWKNEYSLRKKTEPDQI